MSSHVGTVIFGGFPPEKEVISEKLEGQHSSSIMYSNLSFEQGKPCCMPILSYLLCLYHFLYLQMYCALMYRICMKM
jgi:hypothetical protein